MSLVLICRRCACDMAAVSAWDTVPIWEQKWRATLIIPVFTAGMTAKLTRVQLSRHAGGKALWWLKLLAVHVLIRPRCSPGSTGGYVTGTLVVYENQALTNEPLLSSQSSFRGHLPVPWGWLLNGGWIQLIVVPCHEALGAHLGFCALATNKSKNENVSSLETVVTVI